MAITTTTNLGLTKDDPTEMYSVERVNANTQKIDDFAGEIRAGKANTADLAAIAASGDSEDAAYDNTVTGMNAENVQAAIDELHTLYAALEQRVAALEV